jgi:hypothetical protein
LLDRVAEPARFDQLEPARQRGGDELGIGTRERVVGEAQFAFGRLLGFRLLRNPVE